MYSALKNAVNAYLNTGVNENAEPEQARKAFIVNLFAFVGCSITGSLGLKALINGQSILGLSLCLSACVYLATHKLQRSATSPKHLPATLLQLNLMVLMLYLIVTGGVENTGPLWMYLIPPVFMFLGGQKGGLLSTAVFMSLYSIVMFYPDDALLLTSYTFAFKTRALMAFATLTFLAAFYEYSRHSTYTHVKELSKRFEQQARRDPLTQLHNRRAMLEQLEYEHNRATRNEQVFSIMLLDVDDFKQFNDTYGHDGGDRALIKLADFFQANCRKQDVVCRWGGEEFLFLLPDTTIQDATIYAERICQGTRQVNIEYDDLLLNVSVSIGVSQVAAGQPVQEALITADQRLYMAKEGGRNRVVSDS